MSPQNPPRRPGSGLRPVIEVNAAVGPHTIPPLPPFDARKTLPPAHEHAAPPSYRRPAEEDSPPMRRPRTQTLTGMPAPPSERPAALHDASEDEPNTGVTSANSLFEQYAAQKKRADSLADELKERARLRAKWEALGIKLGGAVVSVVVALCGYLVWRIGQLEHKADNADANASAQKAIMDGLPARVAKIEQYERDDKVLENCKESHTRSAIKRATGYDLTTLSDSCVVHWSSEGTKPNLIWFPVEQCVPPGSSEPRPPGSQ